MVISYDDVNDTVMMMLMIWFMMIGVCYLMLMMVYK